LCPWPLVTLDQAQLTRVGTGTRMSRRRRTFLAIGTFWSFLYIIPFVVFVCVLFVDGVTAHRWPVSNRVFIVVWALTVATLIVNVALAYAYYRELSTNPRAPANKDRWRFLLLYTGPFAMIVYWYRYVRGGNTHCQGFGSDVPPGSHG
jgi:hypothetical protein